MYDKEMRGALQRLIQFFIYIPFFLKRSEGSSYNDFDMHSKMIKYKEVYLDAEVWLVPG